LTVAATALLIIAISIVISLIYPICSLLCPCLRPDEERQPIVGVVNTFGNGSVENVDNQTITRGNNKKCCLYLTLVQWLSIILLSIILTTTHVTLSIFYTFSWHDATYGAQSYIDTQWNDAMCNNDEASYKPLKSAEQIGCSFSYPEATNSTNTYWSCCKNTTCSSAFEYSLLLTGYAERNDSCLTDMDALTKASCHPLMSQFVGSNFDIAQSPLTKSNVTFSNSVAVCYLFCQQTYGDCKDKYLSNSTMTVSQRYSSADEFCTKELGVVIRYEVFTDRCFAGCSMLHVGYTFVAILLVWITM